MRFPARAQAAVLLVFAGACAPARPECANDDACQASEACGVVKYGNSGLAPHRACRPVDEGPWRLMSPGPSPRSFVAVSEATDAGLLVFGGADSTTTFAESWEWNGAGWRRLEGPGPPARHSHAVAWDAARRRVVLFAGHGAALDDTLGDTWEWNGSAWEDLTPIDAPPPRSGHAMAWDAQRGQVVLFGGQDAKGHPLGDTWIWDGTAWAQRPTAVAPGPRVFPAMAYDRARGRVVLFGGETAPPFVGQGGDETWEWDGSQWAQRTPPTRPLGRSLHALAWDETRQRTLLFGGQNLAVDPFSLADTWEWDGDGWVERTLRGPGKRFAHGMASVGGHPVVFGGTDSISPFDDLWRRE